MTPWTRTNDPTHRWGPCCPPQQLSATAPWKIPSLLPQAAPLDLMVFAHALRRHWVMAVGIGVLVAALIGPAVWWGYGERYTASAFLTVAIQEKPILPTFEALGADRDRFEIYKNTQQQLLQNRFVLLAALRTEIKDLPVIKALENVDAVAWLARQLSVGFPGRAELMEVSVTRKDPKEAQILVNGVVNAYLNEVVNRDHNIKQQHFNELDRAYNAKQDEVRDQRTRLKQFAESLGTDEKETLTIKERMFLEELTTYRSELTKVQFDLRFAQGSLSAQQAMLKTIDAIEIGEADVDSLVQSDPVARQLFVEVGWRRTDQAYNQGRVAEGKKSRIVDHNQKDLKTMQDQFDQRRSALAEVARQKRRSIVEAQIVQLESGIEVLKQQEAQLLSEVELKQKEAEKFGSSTVDVEMLREDIKSMDTVLTQIAAEKEKLSVEMRNESRVTLLQPADLPEMPSNDLLRTMLTAMAMVVGLVCPAGAVTLWDLRAKRINTCDDVSKGLRLSVIGSMPLIPARVIRQLESPSKRSQTWHVRLTESVDGIAARLLRKADTEQCRVIMVSSAVGGEGKTTLATQLALSLARSGTAHGVGRLRFAAAGLRRSFRAALGAGRVRGAAATECGRRVRAPDRHGQPGGGDRGTLGPPDLGVALQRFGAPPCSSNSARSSTSWWSTPARSCRWPTPASSASTSTRWSFPCSATSARPRNPGRLRNPGGLRRARSVEAVVTSPNEQLIRRTPGI